MSDKVDRRYEPGDHIIWQQSMRGFHEGKCSNPALFMCYTGTASARIKVGDVQRTVRLSSIGWCWAEQGITGNAQEETGR